VTEVYEDELLALTVWTAEQTKMNDCYFEKKDWRICNKEVRTSACPSDS
jgi:hypothetical protein